MGGPNGRTALLWRWNGVPAFRGTASDPSPLPSVVASRPNAVHVRIAATVFPMGSCQGKRLGTNRALHPPVIIVDCACKRL